MAPPGAALGWTEEPFSVPQDLYSAWDGREKGKAAEAALVEFEARFQRGVLPEDMPEVSVSAGSITQVLKAAGLTASTSEAQRMINGGGVRINGERVGDGSTALAAGECVVMQVGKRKFARVTIV